MVERLESESIELKSQMELAAENRIKRLTEKFNSEIKFLEESEKQAQTKYLEMKNLVMNNENDLVYMRTTIKELEVRYQEAEKVIIVKRSIYGESVES